MNWVEIGLWLLIAAAVILAVVSMIRRKKKGGCCGSCSGCSCSCPRRLKSVEPDQQNTKK